MKILIVLAVVVAILAIAAYLRKRAFRDFIPQDPACSEEVESVIL